MLNDTREIHWGIIGCGSIAHKFATDLKTVPKAILYAVASRDLQKAEKFGQLHGATRFYGQYEVLMQDPLVDIIYIATPHPFHCENAVQCLEHKKAVLCEKPLAMNIKEVEQMIQSAKATNCFLMEALWTYFLPHYQYVLEVIESQALGNITLLEADFGFKGNTDPNGRLYDKSLGGGSLLDVGIYPLFTALTLLGYPTDYEAEATFAETGVDTDCYMHLYYENGAQAKLYSAIHKETKTEARIVLEKGEIHIHSRFHEPSSVTVITTDSSENFTFPVTTNGYNFEAKHAQEQLLKNNIESPLMTFEKSRQLMQLIDGIREKIGLVY